MSAETSAMSAQKKTAVLRVLDTGIVMIHCDPHLEGVSLPDFLKEDPIVRLNFAYGFQLDSFEVDDEAISAVLNFNGNKSYCVIPWDSIFAITAPQDEHRGWFWRESAPREALLEFFNEDDEGLSEEEMETERYLPSVRPTLRIVDSDGPALDEELIVEEMLMEHSMAASAVVDSSEIPEEPEEPPSGGPSLRLVK